MANEVTQNKDTGEHESAFGTFEEKIKEFQGNLKDLMSVQNLDDLKTKWDHISSQTRSEIEEHPLQMVALGGVLGFSLGLAGKKVDVKEVSSRVVDWAAKLGAAWAVDKISDRGGTKGSDQPIH